MDARTPEPQSTGRRTPLATDPLWESEIEACLCAALVIELDPPGVKYNGAFAEMWALPSEPRCYAEPDAIFERVLRALREPGAFRDAISRLPDDMSTPVRRELELLDGRRIEASAAALRRSPTACTGRIWYFHDRTAQRDSEKALRASHALLARAERIAHVGGWDWDLVRDEIVWSEETCRIFGRDPHTHVPTLSDFMSSVHPDDRRRVRAAIDVTLAEGAPFDIEFRIVVHGGGERIIHTQAETTAGDGGRIVRLSGTCRDITEPKLVERELRLANALFTSQLESSPDAILVVDPDRRIVSFNRRFVELWNLPDEVAESGSDERAVACVLHLMKDPAAFLRRLEDLYAHPLTRSSEELELNDGRVLERHSGPLATSGLGRPGRIFFFRDITERKLAERHVERLARHDGLTGLHNRSSFVESIRLALARTQRTPSRFALLYLDLDHFKDVNDTLGHPAGDQLLRQVADRLRATVRQPDVVARFGGDEFGLLLADVRDLSDAAALAERIQQELREPFCVLGNDVRIGASIGMAVGSSEIVDPETLLSHADLALYRAKSDGRGTSRFFAERMDEEVRARVGLVSDLRRALDRDELFLHYQPQVDTRTGRIVGLEALVRWQHPVRGRVRPDDFIGVAEKSGLIVPLGRWVLRTACLQAKRWIDAGIGPDFVAVNVSGAQFRTPFELQATLSAILAESGLPPNRLELELTESVLMAAWLDQRDALLGVRESGVRVAIDDFGTGFSSLQYLTSFPLDRLKIAQAFVAELCDAQGQPTGNAAIVKATIGLARELGLQVVAEGVETHEQLVLLRSWGCRDVQGYYLAKPAPADEIEDLLRRKVLRPPTSHPPARGSFPARDLTGGTAAGR